MLTRSGNEGVEALIQNQNKIRPAVYGIVVYFLLAAMDSFQIGTMGSVLKIVALIPLALLIFDLQKLRLRFHPLLVVQLLFWLLAVLSLFYSINVEKTTGSVMTLTLNLVLVFALGLLEQYNEREIALMQRALFWGGWLTIVLMMFFSDFSAGGRLTLKLNGATQDQNYINGYFLYTFSCHCNEFFRNKKRSHAVYLLIIMAIVLMTGSRGALLAFAATGFVHVCFQFAQSKNAMRNILLTAVFFALLGVLFDLILSLMPENVAVRYSWEYIAEKGTTGRSRIWRFLLAHFERDSMGRMLFGHGYGTSALLNTLRGTVAHNLYLDNLITLGIFGLVLQLITQGIVLKTLLKRKEYALVGAYIGFIAMCISLSLVAYKPNWNIMLLMLAVDCRAADAGKEPLC